MTRRLACVLVALAFVVPWIAGCASREPATLRVLSYNIRHGDGMDRRIDLERIARVICEAKPDLVALEEVDRGVTRSSKVDQPAELGKLTGMHAVFEKNINFQGGEYGNAVLSRFPVESHENHYLPQSIPGEQRGALEVRVRVRAKGHPIVFIATHLDYHPSDGERLASIAVLKDLVARCGTTPVIIAGDFNSTPDSEVMRRAGSFLGDTFDPAGSAKFTFPADAPKVRIDYILYSRSSGLKCTEYRIIPEPVASDHRPILAVFSVGPSSLSQ
jgi:endonuclease/exonuclease/phosphatase family metal-dependent hydrolase